MKILVTGASGFIGSFIVERAIELGFEVWAGVRSGSSKIWLTDARIHFIHIDLAHPSTLKEALLPFKENENRWDVVVHAAGATKAKDEKAFFDINCEGTRLLVNMLRELDLVPDRFIYLSSLSVLGDIKENPMPGTDGCHYLPMTDTDSPEPNTSYGRSKLAAENFLHSLPDFPFVILRPTGVYGPREKDYLLMAKSIKRHFDFAVGYRPQKITFIYVRDLVEAIFLAARKGGVGQAYLLSDGHVYSSRTFSDLLQKEMGKKFVLHIKAPLWLLYLVCQTGKLMSLLTGKTSTLNSDKYKILKQRNWCCDIQPACRQLGYTPEYDLPKGVRETVAWYKAQKWI